MKLRMLVRLILTLTGIEGMQTELNRLLLEHDTEHYLISTNNLEWEKIHDDFTLRLRVRHGRSPNHRTAKEVIPKTCRFEGSREANITEPKTAALRAITFGPLGSHSKLIR